MVLLMKMAIDKPTVVKPKRTMLELFLLRVVRSACFVFLCQ